MKTTTAILTISSLMLSFSSCQDVSKDVKPQVETKKSVQDTKNSLKPKDNIDGGTNYTTDAPPDRKLLGSTNVGNVYATIGTENQLQTGLNALAAHGEVSYEGFDTSQIYIVSSAGSNSRAFVFASVSNTANMQKALVISDFGTADANPVIVETTAKSIVYNDYAEGKQIEVKSTPNGIVATTYSMNNSSATRRMSWGDGTAHCIQDVYSNHGWISVWAVVQSAYIPFTAVAIAADCALHNI